VLSVDSLRVAFKRADVGLNPKIENSRHYALPLRFVWLLIAVAYFYPGLAKFLSSPVGWAFSDNMKFQLYAKWFELQGWLPSIRIDEHPWAYKLSGLSTLIFELFFWVLLLFSSLRMVAAVVGLGFHLLVRFFMNISFSSLQVSYVALIDWARVFRWVGKKLFPQKLYVLYDGHCKLCRRAIAVIKSFDIFDALNCVNAFDSEKLAIIGAQGIPEEDLFQDMHVLVGKQKWLGFKAYRKAAIRVPILWPLWLLFWIPPVPAIGQWLYRKVADSRTCALMPKLAKAPTGPKLFELRALQMMGFGLLLLNSHFGLHRQTQAWPFACFPMFRGKIRTPEKAMVEFYGLVGDREEAIDFSRVADRVSRVRFLVLAQKIINIKDTATRKEKFRALLSVLQSEGSDLSRYRAFRYYQVYYSTIPEKYGEPSLRRKLIGELEL
jgi:predicted DCC family thiol-disulfide oxidoreductase YuxK